MISELIRCPRDQIKNTSFCYKGFRGIYEILNFLKPGGLKEYDYDDPGSRLWWSLASRLCASLYDPDALGDVSL